MDARVILVSVAAVFGLAAGVAAQSAATSLLESPVKVEGEIASAGETISCTVPLGGGTASLFGVDELGGQSPSEFIGNELFGSFRVFHVDENCTVLSTWTTVFPGTTSTGIAWDHVTTTTYWNVDPFTTGSILEFNLFTGTATGANTPLAAGFPGSWGPLAIDRNQGGKIAYCEDIAADVAVEYNLVTDAIGCSFPNPDNAGSGAYGNGMSPAADTGVGAGRTLVMSSGAIADGQVVRASQLDCTGVGAYGTWDIATPTGPSGEFFVNGICEFVSASGGDRRLIAMGNVTSLFFNIGRPIGIHDCQGKDSPDSDVLFVNSSRGGADYTVEMAETDPLCFVMQKPPAGGNGKFVVHMNDGAPSAGTITTMGAGLGDLCFPMFLPPFGAGDPVSVFNNIGKTERIGRSNWMADPRLGPFIPDPVKAPTCFWCLAAGDTANMPSGTEWTLQGIILNPASSSPKGASITNAVLIQVL